ncbi:MAG: AMP-dependent synthetase and ligase [uncultured bacterium]|nr:MAG: AMP-dependent synthetase and ligase [uncultured bacterium]
MHLEIIDQLGHVADQGEVAIVPPSIGLSTTLLNADHHQIYFEAMPTLDNKPLRRHGDQIKRLSHHTYSIQGRVDDSMNLGGIKVSAAEIERAITGLPEISEVAAIAVTPPNHGPSQLIIYAVTKTNLDKQVLIKAMQKKINTNLNPLFKISDIVLINEMPKTASNKIMRRLLRDQYNA